LKPWLGWLIEVVKLSPVAVEVPVFPENVISTLFPLLFGVVTIWTPVLGIKFTSLTSATLFPLLNTVIGCEIPELISFNSWILVT
jgi:hypothetical protein